MATAFFQGIEIDPETMIWRVMPRSRFLELIRSRSVYFPSAFQFNDPWEGSVAVPSKSAMQKPLAPFPHLHAHMEAVFEQLGRLTKISCWQMGASEQASMWARYSRSEESVAIRSTVKRLFASLGEFRLAKTDRTEEIVVGRVRYIDFQAERMANPSMLARFFYKDASFSYESELRAAISLRAAKENGIRVPSKGIRVPVNIAELIDSIYVSPLLRGSIDSLAKSVKAAGFALPVRESSLRLTFL